MKRNDQNIRHFFCSGLKMLSVGATGSKSKYITKGKSSFALKSS